MDVNLIICYNGCKLKLMLLINDPYILFCDEPTTGLDSSSAMMVVKILEATTMSGKMILVTLHQPSSQIFDLFNDIILLANGKLIFEGSKQQAKLFFESANLYCPVSYNPADFYMKHITASYENDSELRKITRLCKLFNDNFQRPNEGTNFYHSNGLFKQRINKKNVMVQLKWLIWRAFIDSKRSLYIYKTNYICLMIGALIIATLFSNVKLDSSSSVQSIQGALFLIVSELVFTHMYCVIPIFPEEVVVFVREKSLYSSFPYFFSKVLSLIPVCFVNGISFLIVYFTVLQFLQSIPLFLNMCVILIFTCLCGIALGLCLSALFPSVEYIHLFIVPLETAAMLVSGIWIKIDTLPRVISFLKYFSPFYYGFQGISIVAWEKVDFIGIWLLSND
ncbi:hypothetical protein NQ315_002585 [Exocentrus adspersus]|uniref:Uncharacterized protein n=1 Tax=Exocentrus adspersus TaxID=1586481 RepID=A0AAV8VU66_9CUCU|nr:hypothetical protein NQ315_002585 [Exocentrus adspersus]